MSNRPAYPSELGPKEWEKNKGTLAKAVVRADVKGSLEKAANAYWKSVPWDALDDAAALTAEELKPASDKLEDLKNLIANVQRNAAQGVREIEKVPANKQLMKQVHAYLEKMEAKAKSFEDELEKFIKQAEAANNKATAAQEREESGLEGFLEQKTKQAKDLVQDCVLRCQTVLKPNGGGKPAMTHADGLADEAMKEIHTMYAEADAKFLALGPMPRLMAQKPYSAFKAKEATYAAAITAVKNKLAAAVANAG